MNEWSYSEYRDTHAKRRYRVRNGRKLSRRQLEIFNEARLRLGWNPSEARIRRVVRWIEEVR